LPGILGQAGWGWHSECAVHALRLVLSGALDRHPGLQIVIGHLGEGLQVMLDRFDDVFDRATPSILKRTVRETLLDQLHVTTSGFFSHPSLLALLQTFGADRIMFSVDYPYSDNAKARAFLDELELAPADKAKIAHGNADKLLKLKAG
jgi:predicted TIM-barrel fold metal-dependent hydrolase